MLAVPDHASFRSVEKLIRGDGLRPDKLGESESIVGLEFRDFVHVNSSSVGRTLVWVGPI